MQVEVQISQVLSHIQAMGFSVNHKEFAGHESDKPHFLRRVVKNSVISPSSLSKF